MLPKKGPRRSGVPASPVESKLQSDRDGFGAEIAVQYRFAHFAPPTGMIVTTERQRRVEDVVAIGPDGSGLYLRRQQVCLTDVTSPDTSREPIDAVIRLSDQILIHVLERHRGHDGAEDLLLNDLHVRASIDEHGGLHEISCPLPRRSPLACSGPLLLAALTIP